jgi:predicted nucleotidyltransferase
MNEIDKIEKLLKDEENIIFAYVFGSYVDGSYHRDSDIDIALFLKEESFDYYLCITHLLEKNVKKRIDVTILNNTKNLYLLENIIKKSKVIKNSKLREDFEIKKWHEILDFKELQQRFIDA